MEECLRLDVYDFIDEFFPVDLFLDRIKSIIGADELTFKNIEVIEDIEEEDHYIEELDPEAEEGNYEIICSGEIQIDFDRFRMVLTRTFTFEFDGDEWNYTDTNYNDDDIFVQCKFCDKWLKCEVSYWYESHWKIENCGTCKKKNTWLMIGKRIGLDRNFSRDVSKFIN